MLFSLTVAHGATETNRLLSFKTAISKTDAIKEKPATFDNWSQRMDYIHDNFHNVMQSRTEATDLFLANGTETKKQEVPSRFRLGLYLESDVDEGFSLKFDPSFESEISLPNTEERWKLIITGKEIDEMPDTKPSEREKGFSAGIQKGIKDLPIKLDAGVRIRWLPEGFLKLSWRTLWNAGNWSIIPSQKCYYETDEGFGEVSALSTYLCFGEKLRGTIGTASAVRWSEDTDGVEWSHSLRLGHISESIEKDYRKKSIRMEDTARGTGIKLAVYGHKNGTGIVDRYRLTFIHRRPLYKQWVYLEIAPEVEWQNEYDWDAEYTLRIGFDMLFWGTKTR